MKAQYKLAIALLPFLATGAIASMATYPAYIEDQGKRLEVNSKRQENDALEVKLKEKNKAEKEQQNLKGQIENLRGSVPKSPELDLFVLDLEKMCGQSHVDLISVETPEPETMRALEASEQDMRELAEESSGKLAIGSKTLQKESGQPGQKSKDKQDETALKQLVKQVYVTGDYDGIIALMKRLESYQRVTGVKQVAVALPTEGNEIMRNPATDRAKKLKLQQPVMAFLMTLYYLP